MRIKLTSIDPWACQHEVLVERLPAIVGRALDADVCVSDQWVSRVHCELYELNGTLAVRDVGSRHGTFVNGLRIQETLLLPGNRLSLGMTTLKVEYKRRSAKAAPSADGQTETIQNSGQTLSELGNVDAGHFHFGNLSPLPETQLLRDPDSRESLPRAKGSI